MGAQLAWGDEHEIAKALAAISRAAADAERPPAADEGNAESDSSVSDHE